MRCPLMHSVKSECWIATIERLDAYGILQAGIFFMHVAMFNLPEIVYIASYKRYIAISG